MSGTSDFVASKPVLAIAGFLIVQSAAIGFWGGDLHRTVTTQGAHIDDIDANGTRGMRRVEAVQEAENTRVAALEAERATAAAQYRDIDHRLNQIEAKMDQLLAAALPSPMRR